MDKSSLRLWISEQKRACSKAEKLRQSEFIFDQVLHSEWYEHSDRILCYWSMPDEVHTHDFVLQASQERSIYLPVIVGNDLWIRRFEDLSRMVPGPGFGILEPTEDCESISLESLDVVIVPGLAFDRRGGRMGRGRGFYDRLLSAKGPYTVGIGFSFQEVAEVPLEPHDIRLQSVIFGV